jgi:ferredoxin
MANVVINDEQMEAQPGETLLDVARRNRAHIGFFCDGRAFCTTCRSRITAGAEQLSPVNDAERQVVTRTQLDEGYRLACQARVQGPGPITAMTRVEELRRSADGGLGNLLNHLANQAAYQVSLFPAIIPIGFSRVINKLPKPQEIADYGRDLVGIVQRTASGRSLEDQRKQESRQPQR